MQMLLDPLGVSDSKVWRETLLTVPCLLDPSCSLKLVLETWGFIENGVEICMRSDGVAENCISSHFLDSSIFV